MSLSVPSVPLCFYIFHRVLSITYLKQETQRNRGHGERNKDLMSHIQSSDDDHDKKIFILYPDHPTILLFNYVEVLIDASIDITHP